MWHPHADQSSPRLFLGQRAPTSVQPEPHLFAGSSSPDTQCVPVQPGDWAGSSAAKQRPRFRRSPFSSGRTSSDAAYALRIGPKSELSPGNGASKWRPFLLRCSSCVAFSRGLSVLLTEERSLHFQLKRNKQTIALARVMAVYPEAAGSILEFDVNQPNSIAALLGRDAIWIGGP